MYTIVNGFFQVLQLAILARVLYSWVDRNPYPDNALKRGLWMVTDPILEPLRKIIPPMGMIDITPIAAFFLIQIVQRIIVDALWPYGAF